MDATRFEHILRTLADSPSRRGVLRFLAGLALSGGLVTAPSATARKRGKSKSTDRDKSKKKRTAQKPAPSPPLPPAPPTCPAACPPCQTCDAAIGLCLAQPNGEVGISCEEPKVCCGGVCCAPIHECNGMGTCKTCAEKCDDPKCSTCFHLNEGGTVCGDGYQRFCTEPCALSANCFGGKVCVTSFTFRSDNQTHQVDCELEEGKGVCAAIVPCA